MKLEDKEVSYEWNPYFQYLKSNFKKEDIKGMRRRSGRKASVRKDRPAISNGDMIRSMCDVELANFLATDAVISCVHCKENLHTCSEGHPCSKAHQAGVFCNWLGEEWVPGRWTYE